MRSINVSRRIPAAPEKVWAVLADFPNIATWNTAVRRSFRAPARVQAAECFQLSRRGRGILHHRAQPPMLKRVPTTNARGMPGWPSALS